MKNAKPKQVKIQNPLIRAKAEIHALTTYFAKVPSYMDYDEIIGVLEDGDMPDSGEIWLPLENTMPEEIAVMLEDLTNDFATFAVEILVIAQAG